MNDQLQANLQEINQRIATAAKKSGRSSDDVTLIGVTKYVDAATTRALVQAGCNSLGESRPQVLWDKAESLQDLDVQWHMIGHLQRNKVKRTVSIANLIHSADSLRLIEAIQKTCKAETISANILLEVNVSGEEAKHGFSSKSLDPILQCLTAVASMKEIKVQGLMAMAGLAGNQDDARREFALLREFRDQLAEREWPENIRFDQLSMGMSNDFDIAIEEGATLVRVGSALFQGIV